MIVIEASKSTSDLRVSEVKRAVIGSDPGRESLANSEMCCFPCHLFVKPDRAFCDTGNSDFPRMCCGPHVQIDVTRKIETAVDWRFHPRFEIDDGQAFIFPNLRVVWFAVRRPKPVRVKF